LLLNGQPLLQKLNGINVLARTAGTIKPVAAQ